ncbi:hypothetical protein THASP1DRAFT_16580 [Thamnocephalis sphaerospora]|uniref:EamA domain-containing protein n=1 Tax=Thamnocephalis sphaerospora TaxID=78915 RepID=A0A4P9XP78_9FUNG|nr:hypothetical protein THASP1DRAFT_16580 [Thamnocephalis sphaerospora]|eukprot:RKP07778.1 hypothetical protein THASP1DRAFT_16580 [Thamnocephalis sphaerospora]
MAFTCGSLRISARYLRGIAALVGVIACWVGSSFAVSNIFVDHKYNKPFFLTYFNTCTFTLYLGVYWVLYGRPSQQRWDRQVDKADERRMTLGEIAQVSAKFCVLWFAANLMQNASLAYTSVASSTVMSSTSGLFTLLIGALVGVERVSLLRCVAVLGSLAGIALVVNAPGHDAGRGGGSTSDLPRQLFGDVLALLGAFFYGCYSVLLKCQMRNDTRQDNMLFLGLVGLLNMLGLWPVIVGLDWLGVETFALPSSGTVWAIILGNAFIGTFLSDYLWLVAVLLTSPLVVTLGIAFTIPITLMGDILFKGLVIGSTYWLGAALVLLGFVGVNGAVFWERRDRLSSPAAP